MTRRRFDDEHVDDGPEPGMAMREAASPEPDTTDPKLRAAAMRRAAKAALKANPDMAATVTRQPEPLPEPAEATAESQSPEAEAEAEPKRVPWQSDGTPISTVTAGEPTNVAEAEAWARSHGAIDEHGQSRKLAARKAQEAKEVEARERGDAEHVSHKLSFTGNTGTDAEYEQARQSYERATAHLRELEAEQAGFTGRMQDAIEQQDLDLIKTLRERQRELPDLIFAARMGVAQAELAFMQLRAARKRIAKQEARAAASKVSADFQEFQRRVNEAANAAQTASYESDDAVRDVGAAQRKLDALKAEALAQAIGPQAHRVPMGVHESGADLSNLAPLG